VISTRFLPESFTQGNHPQQCHHVQLPPLPRSVAAARGFVRSHAPDLPTETEESLELMTSELVTNAVLHARTVLDIEVLITETSLVVGVHDLDLATPLQTPYSEREGGWGLALVQVLAHDWSIQRHHEGGKTVWFQLLRTEAHLVDSGAAARSDADRRDS
jgi:anti-sigma regulatory factor (Ser/Thr protein kinase)